jgi:hypothetical protein
MLLLNIFKSIVDYFKFLNLVDITFLVAIITLIILIVTLIYFVKINNDVLQDSKAIIEQIASDDQVDNSNNIVENIEIKEENNDNQNEYNDEEGALLDLDSLTEKLKNDSVNNQAGVSEYEKDQEAKAIISYDELIKNKNKYAINYENEEVMDDLVIKKVDLNDLDNKSNIEVSMDEVKVISYAKEEAFLQALKELNNLLN